MALTVTRRGIAASIGLVAGLGGLAGRAAAGDLFKHHKTAYYAAPSPYAASAPPAYAPPAYAPPAYGAAPAYYAPAPAYYVAPNSHHAGHKLGHHTQTVVPIQPAAYYVPYAYPAAVPYGAYAPAPYQTPSYATSSGSTAGSAPSAEVLPEAQKALKLTPAMMGKFLDDLRKSYAQNTDAQTGGLAKVSALRKYAQDQYKDFQGDNSAELTPEQVEKLDDAVEMVVKEDNDRVARSTNRYAEGQYPSYYPPYAPGYPYGHRPARPIRWPQSRSATSRRPGGSRAVIGSFSAGDRGVVICLTTPFEPLGPSVVESRT